MSTVHDEINYTIDKEVTTDYVRELEQLMTFDTLDKTLPITTSTDIGFTYGNMFPFRITYTIVGNGNSTFFRR